MAKRSLSEFEDQSLLFFIESDVDDELAARMAEWLRELNDSYSWNWRTPEFFDSIEEPENPEVDFPVRTTGGVYWLKSPWNQDGQELPPEVDLAQLEDVEKIVESMAAFSECHGLEIGFELDGTSVGWIKNGSSDRMLQEGLLEPWREKLSPPR